MNKIIFALVLCIVFALSANVRAAGVVSSPANTGTLPLVSEVPASSASDACFASKYQNLKGKSEADLANVIFKAKRVRIICATCAATMDFSAERLTIQLDGAGKVQSLQCN